MQWFLRLTDTRVKIIAVFTCPGRTRGGTEGSISPKLDLTTGAEYVANVVM